MKKHVEAWNKYRQEITFGFVTFMFYVFFRMICFATKWDVSRVVLLIIAVVVTYCGEKIFKKYKNKIFQFIRRLKMKFELEREKEKKENLKAEELKTFMDNLEDKIQVYLKTHNAIINQKWRKDLLKLIGDVLKTQENVDGVSSFTFKLYYLCALIAFAMSDGNSENNKMMNVIYYTIIDFLFCKNDVVISCINECEEDFLEESRYTIKIHGNGKNTNLDAGYLKEVKAEVLNILFKYAVSPKISVKLNALIRGFKEIVEK